MLKKLFGWGKPSGDEAIAHPEVDVAMQYCPSCGDEYRAGVTTCSSCKVPLVSGKERLAEVQGRERARASRSMDISPGDALVAIRAGKMRDLKPLQFLLAKELIPARIVGDNAGCGKG